MASTLDRLNAHFARLRADGVLDVKFAFSPEISDFMHQRLLNPDHVPDASRLPSFDAVCEDVLTILDAVAAGHFVEVAGFGDSRRGVATA